jgi:hypothetical protein
MTLAIAERKVNVGIVQMQCSDNPDANMAKALDMTRDNLSEVAILATLFERRAPGFYRNTTAVIDGAAGYAGL